MKRHINQILLNKKNIIKLIRFYRLKTNFVNIFIRKLLSGELKILDTT